MGIKCPKCQHENPDDTLYCGKCATSLTSSDDASISITKTIISPPMEGSTIAGKYRIIEKLGEGGMGVVYKAEDTRLKRTVALKFMPQELTRDPDAKERFEREAQAAAALSHPNICTVYEIGEDQGKSFIAMEYIEGQSIREKVKKSPLEIQEALDIAIQAAQGLEEAHKREIIHRDVKSANIMVTSSGQVKVMDFGLAKVTGASLLTREASTMGTVAYMSPEQAQGQSVDQRTDIWSLGVVLYEMLTGQFPFPGDTDQSVMYAIARKNPVSMKKIVPKVKPELERVVEKVLSKNPADRYQSMGELLEDLRAIAEGMKPIRAKSRLFRGRILGIRKPYFYAGALIVAALVVFGVLTFFPGRIEVLNSIAILPIINESGDPSQDYFANSLTTLMISEFYKVEALNVVPPESVRVYKNSNKTSREIARELKVKAIVQASVFLVGDKIRLVATLSDPFRNKILWSDNVEKDYSEIMILQSELCQAIVEGIKVAITPEEKMRIASASKVNPEAYDLVLQGLEHISQVGEIVQQWKDAKDCFQKAVDIDPDMALAQAWLSAAYWWLGADRVIPEKEAFLKARDAASKAIELDENLGMAYSSLGSLKMSDWDFAGAESDFKKAVELEPGNPWQQLQYSHLLVMCRRFEEGIAIVKRLMDQQGMIDLDAALIQHWVYAGKYDEAIELARKRINSGPYSSFFHLALAWALTEKKMYAEALAELEMIRKNVPETDEDYFVQTQNAYTLAWAGRRDDALKKLEEVKIILAKSNMIDTSYESAAVYAILGEKDKALKFLHQAYDNHHPNMIWLNVDSHFHSLYGDPRFEELQKKVGFQNNPAQKNR